MMMVGRMLEPAAANWRGTVGEHFSSGAEFANYLGPLVYTGWRPQGIVLHNTGAPNIGMWRDTTPSLDPVVDGEQRLKNIASGYRAKGWQGGPHLFITDTLIWVFNPLTQRGTHSPNFNALYWGIEMVGDFDREPFNPAIRDLTVEAIAAMCSARGLDPNQLKLHKDDPAGHQDCPGKNVNRGEMIGRTLAKMAGEDTGGHAVAMPPVPTPRPAVDPFIAGKHLQAALNELGAKPALEVDGWLGAKTKAALLAQADR